MYSLPMTEKSVIVDRVLLPEENRDAKTRLKVRLTIVAELGMSELMGDFLVWHCETGLQISIALQELCKR